MYGTGEAEGIITEVNKGDVKRKTSGSTVG